MYSLELYGAMMADERRVAAYSQALRRAIRPESVVLDLGCGAGIMTLLACRLGARRVYAIEADDVIQVAKEIAKANGCAERIVFIQDLSTRVSLPERVDVVFSDLRGVLPLYQRHIPSIADARRRFLAPGGVLIPRQDTIWAAPLEAPQVFQRLRAGWETSRDGLDLEAGLRYATNELHRERFAPEQLLAEPGRWATLDYGVIEDANVSGDLQWTIHRAGTGHGFVAWFDAVLAEGVSFSNAPEEPETVWGSAYFPWGDAVPLAVGDTVSVRLAADLVAENYVWSWETRVLEGGDASRVKAGFQQSTFFGMLLSPEHLRRHASDHVPALSQEGEIDRLVISMMDGKSCLEEIARRLAQQFPGRFANWKQALTRVGELSQKYGR